MQKETILKATMLVQSVATLGICAYASRVIAHQYDTSQKRKAFIETLVDAIASYEPYVPPDVVQQVREKVQFETMVREF